MQDQLTHQITYPSASPLPKPPHSQDFHIPARIIMDVDAQTQSQSQDHPRSNHPPTTPSSVDATEENTTQAPDRNTSIYLRARLPGSRSEEAHKHFIRDGEHLHWGETPFGNSIMSHGSQCLIVCRDRVLHPLGTQFDVVVDNQGLYQDGSRLYGYESTQLAKKFNGGEGTEILVVSDTVYIPIFNPAFEPSNISSKRPASPSNLPGEPSMKSRRG